MLHLVYIISNTTSLPLYNISLELVFCAAALRRSDGNYVINGNWAINWSGEYEAAGTHFTYRRQDANNGELIEAPGPLLESVDLMVGIIISILLTIEFLRGTGKLVFTNACTLTSGRIYCEDGESFSKSCTSGHSSYKLYVSLFIFRNNFSFQNYHKDR